MPRVGETYAHSPYLHVKRPKNLTYVRDESGGLPKDIADTTADEQNTEGAVRSDWVMRGLAGQNPFRRWELLTTFNG